MTIMEFLKSLLATELDEGAGASNPNGEADSSSLDKEKEGSGSSDGSETKKGAQGKPGAQDGNSADADSEDSKKEDDVMLFNEGWLRQDGSIDESKVSNAEALQAVQAVSALLFKERTQTMINSAISTELKNYNLAVSENALVSALDVNSLKVEDGKVTGVKEAIESLKASEPGFFKSESESNPLGEGFNPSGAGSQNQPINSFAAAFRAMETE